MAIVQLNPIPPKPRSKCCFPSIYLSMCSVKLKNKLKKRRVIALKEKKATVKTCAKLIIMWGESMKANHLIP